MSLFWDASGSGSITRLEMSAAAMVALARIWVSVMQEPPPVEYRSQVLILSVRRRSDAFGDPSRRVLDLRSHRPPNLDKARTDVEARDDVDVMLAARGVSDFEPEPAIVV